jgi:hypothetical protein
MIGKEVLEIIHAKERRMLQNQIFHYQNKTTGNVG